MQSEKASFSDMVDIEQPFKDKVAIQKARRSQFILIVLGALWLALGSYILIQQFSTSRPIRITWVTETEFDTAGFNIYRSTDPNGEFVQINPQLIPSQADPASGASYEYVDDNVEPGQTYYYKLEDVEYTNVRQQHEVIPQEAPQVQFGALFLAAVSFVLGLALITTGIRGLRNL